MENISGQLLKENCCPLLDLQSNSEGLPEGSTKCARIAVGKQLVLSLGHRRKTGYKPPEWLLLTLPLPSSSALSCFFFTRTTCNFIMRVVRCKGRAGSFYLKNRQGC
uniref:Uncharacterized protein n=1 Tax=Sphaerodactylus townsendi TaxID=933632 RepID=A0ACB8EAL4_9SAUR